MSYDALLLDYDGVVVEVLSDEHRLPAFREAIEAQLRADGVKDEALVEQFARSVTYDELQTASERTGIDPERLWQYRDDAIAAVLRRAAREGKKCPYDDVDVLADVDVPMAVASNNQKRVVEAICDTYDLTAHFEAIHARTPTPESLHRKKPEPLFVERACEAIGAENPLYVGDRGKDIVAGQRAGMDTALIRRPHTRDRTWDVEPTYEVDGLDELLPVLNGGAEPRA